MQQSRCRSGLAWLPPTDEPVLVATATSPAGPLRLYAYHHDGVACVTLPEAQLRGVCDVNLDGSKTFSPINMCGRNGDYVYGSAPPNVRTIRFTFANTRPIQIRTHQGSRWVRSSLLRLRVPPVDHGPPGGRARRARQGGPKLGNLLPAVTLPVQDARPGRPAALPTRGAVVSRRWKPLSQVTPWTRVSRSGGAPGTRAHGTPPPARLPRRLVLNDGFCLGRTNQSAPRSW